MIKKVYEKNGKVQEVRDKIYINKGINDHINKLNELKEEHTKLKGDNKQTRRKLEIKEEYSKLKELIEYIGRHQRDVVIRHGRRYQNHNDYLLTLTKNQRNINSNHMHVYIRENKIAFHYANRDIKVMDESGKLLTFIDGQERYLRNPEDENSYYTMNSDIDVIANYIKNVLDEEETRQEQLKKQLELVRRKKGIKSKKSKKKSKRARRKY